MKQPLPEGAVTLTVFATDAQGNDLQDSIALTVDSMPLQIDITSPILGVVTSAAQMTVAGTVAANVTHVSVNGVAATLGGGGFTATVPLKEGTNMLTAVASGANGKTGSRSAEITRDTTVPVVHIDSPLDGFVAVDPVISLTGQINDRVDGGQNPSVTINGVPATVKDGGFMLIDFPLVRGPNAIEAVVTDAAGNTGRHTLQVVYQKPPGMRLGLFSGNGQSGLINALLPQPLTVVVLDDKENPIAGRKVIFEVTRNNGVLQLQPGDAIKQGLEAITNGSGKASVLLTLGSAAGEGSNRVKVTAEGITGDIEFIASSLAATPARIVLSQGGIQRGEVGHPLPSPLAVLVTDDNGNPVANTPINFEVFAGGGHIDGTTTLTRNTDEHGKAMVVFTLGPESGIHNHRAAATFLDITKSEVVIFMASGITLGDPANTRFSGVITDHSRTPILGATVTIQGTALATTTNVEGYFILNNIPVGSIKLSIDANTSPRPETFNTQTYETTTLAGANNTLGVPLSIPVLDDSNTRIVGGNTDVTLTMAGFPGYELTVFANSASFPDGSRTGHMSVTQVHSNQLPMAPPEGGLFAPPVGLLQPEGVVFDPPASITAPNSIGRPAGSIVDFYSFDHDLNVYTRIARGTVSNDGLTVTSDPGMGISYSGLLAPTPAPPSLPSLPSMSVLSPVFEHTCGRSCMEIPHESLCGMMIPISDEVTFISHRFYSVCPRCDVLLPFDGIACNDHDICTVEESCHKGLCGQGEGEGKPVSISSLSISADNPVQSVGQPIIFMTNMDSNCQVMSLHWDFGDGNTAQDNGVHTYATPGTYIVTVTATCTGCGVVRSAALEVTVINLEIFEVITPSGLSSSRENSFIAPNDIIKVSAKIAGNPGLESQIQWQAVPVGADTGAATPATATGTTLTFNARSLQPTTGSRAQNSALEYEVIAQVTVSGAVIEDQVTVFEHGLVKQDQKDILRQEYVDFNTTFKPTRSQISTVTLEMAYLNKGNYESPSIIAEETPGNLQNLLNSVQFHLNSILNNDVQVFAVGTTGLNPTDKIIDPGSPIMGLPVTLDPFGDTDPQGDDVCAMPLENSYCNALLSR